MRHRVIAAGLVLALAALSFTSPSAALPSAPTFPSVTVEVGPVAAVDVNRDSEVNISTNGTVNVTAPAFWSSQINIYFNVTVNNTYWPATISPMSATLTGSGEIPFTVNVTVPGRVSVDAGAEIFVDANVTVPPGIGRSFTDQTPIPILQYFGLSITSKTTTSPENFTAHSGSDAGFAIRLQNLGNGRDSFELSVSNLAELQARGISVNLPSPISVPAKVTVNVNGNISVPASVTAGNFTISIQGLSTGAVAKGETVAAFGEKAFTVVPPDDPGGNNSGDHNETGGKGFLSSFEATLAVAATAGAALLAAAWRRARRP